MALVATVAVAIVVVVTGVLVDVDYANVKCKAGVFCPCPSYSKVFAYLCRQCYKTLLSSSLMDGWSKMS